jgi:hypothetical protein
MTSPSYAYSLNFIFEHAGSLSQVAITYKDDLSEQQIDILRRLFGNVGTLNRENFNQVTLTPHSKNIDECWKLARLRRHISSVVNRIDGAPPLDPEQNFRALLNTILSSYREENRPYLEGWGLLKNEIMDSFATTGGVNLFVLIRLYSEILRVLPVGTSVKTRRQYLARDRWDSPFLSSLLLSKAKLPERAANPPKDASEDLCP